ncbi:MAG: hypothetical protein A2854_03740 [Parcubacteria group bacterium RIFCSPHIGHO2_01_FULL_56_18]|nr:MAG: hypothetical protein A2854_03740 [Parcubacteria group bacterium RIFCSPHIGHO2_01_FULL_56_18]
MILEAVLWGGFGLIFGSFANVLIVRHGTGRGLDGRSACMCCGKTLEWYELIPLLSFLALRGRCSHCHARISLQYPIVEALCGVGFVLVGLSTAPLIVRLIGSAIVILCIAIAAYDLRHMIMPDRWVWSFDILAFITSAYLLSMVSGDILSYAVLAIAGPLVALPLFFMWYVSKGRWMGFGDVKFALGIGWLLGIGYGYLALMYAFVIGAIIGVCILLPLPRIVKLLHRIGITRLGEGSAGFTPTPMVSLPSFLKRFGFIKKHVSSEGATHFMPNEGQETKTPLVLGFTMKSEVPFGPFLILGTCIVWLALIYSFVPILGFPEVLSSH